MANLPLFRGLIIPFLCKQFHIFRPALGDDYHAQMKLHPTLVLQRSFASPTDKNDPRSEGIVHIDCHELRERIRTKNVMLIDVRDPVELEESGRIDGAINIPRNCFIFFYLYRIIVDGVEQAFQMEPADFQKKYGVAKPDKSDKNIVFSCRSGKRSLLALKIANRLGYKWASNFKGGYLEWVADKKSFDDVEQAFQMKPASFQSKYRFDTPD
ncbi:rhodanese-like protein [Opisthorchis viverrini]|uniref:Rhodanese-like protein n=1 Tax=Opisthorchis viverrini TaxID=6198 RepID=A0A1S8X0C3_OPIVI|nr:rhodanese-like protein [Opisthorchis viverrini]